MAATSESCHSGTRVPSAFSCVPRRTGPRSHATLRMSLRARSRKPPRAARDSMRMLDVIHCCDSPLCPTGMKNSIARSIMPCPSDAGTGKNDTIRYSVLRPSCVQYSIFSATADNAPRGRLSITVRIGSGSDASDAGCAVAGSPASSTEPRIALGLYVARPFRRACQACRYRPLKSSYAKSAGTFTVFDMAVSTKGCTASIMAIWLAAVMSSADTK